MHVFYREEKKIAAPLAFIILLLMLIGLAFGINQIKTSARSQKITLDQMELTNLTDHSITLVFKTPAKEIAWVAYGDKENNLNQLRFDDRDNADQKKAYFYHYVTLKNLQERSDYFFKIITQKGMAESYGDKPFTFTTTARFQNLTGLKPAFGKIIQKNQSPLADGLVLLTLQGIYPLSALTTNNGEWLIPLSYLVKHDGSALSSIPSDEPVTIRGLTDAGETAQITTTIAHLSPIPQTMVIGQTIALPEEKTQVLSESTNIAPTVLPTISFLFPKDKALIPGKKPLFKGTALPEKEVSLMIASLTRKKIPVLRTTIRTDKEGVWSFTPSENLAEETYQISLKTIDENNKDVVIDRTFSIAKSGEAVLGEATPSATITITQTPSSPPTPLILATPSSSPTTVVQTPVPPVAGLTDRSVAFLGGALLIVGLGLLLIF